MKMPVFKIFAYKHFFVITLVQISTSTKGLYQKQNGFKFISEILVTLTKIDLHCEDHIPFIHMIQ